MTADGLRLEFLGHAGVHVRTPASALVLDAWFDPEGAFDASWFQLPCNHHLAARDWSRLDAVCVSHEHLDHVDRRFLARLAPRTALLVPRYPSPHLAAMVGALAGRSPRVIAPGAEVELGDLRLRLWAEDSSMNQDTTWVLRAPGGSAVLMVDSRMTPQQLDSILGHLGGPPDVLAIQSAGASWFPLVYESLDAGRRLELSRRKREQKLAYTLAAARQMRPRHLVLYASPPAFLDDELVHANSDPSFPHPDEVRRWLLEQGYAGEILAPLPGDAIELPSGGVTLDPEIRRSFSWDELPAYLAGYARDRAPVIAAARARADAVAVPDLDAALRAHFGRMLALNRYFLERIDMTVCFEVLGEPGGSWLVDFRADRPGVRRRQPGDAFQYRYTLHSRWMRRILADGLRWEDFFLGLRFRAWRDPDVYNDHLLGLLKWNDAASLRAIESYEKSVSDETIVVSGGDGCRYEITRHCPHAGASLETAPIEGRTITCLNHHYMFDLATGDSRNSNCRLRTRRVKPA